MATQQQQVQNTLRRRTEEGERENGRSARRQRLQIEALEQRIAPDEIWGDDPITFSPPPEGGLPPGFP